MVHIQFGHRPVRLNPMSASEERKNAARNRKRAQDFTELRIRIEKRRLRLACASVPGTNPICDETKTNVQAFYMRNISPNFQNGNMETRPVHPVT